MWVRLPLLGQMKRGPYKNRIPLYERAREFRKQSYSYNDIAKALKNKVPLRTIVGWVIDIEVDKKEIYIAAQERKIPIDFPIDSGIDLKRSFILREQKGSCSSCGLDRWLTTKIPLELHHIDGDKSNNTRENLTLICPNCHALTINFKGKNIKKRRKK